MSRSESSGWSADAQHPETTEAELARLRGELAARNGEVARLNNELTEATSAACQAYQDNIRLVRVLSVLSQPSSPAEMSAQALVVLSQTYQADVTCMARAVGERLIVTSDCGLPRGDPAYTDGWELGPGAAEALRWGVPVARHAGNLAGADVPRVLAGLGVFSAVWVPLSAGSGGQLLILFRRAETMLTPADLQVLESVAFRLGIAIAARERSVLAERLANSGHRLTGHLDLPSLFDEACVLFHELGGAETSAIFAIDGDKATLSARHGSDLMLTQRSTTKALPGWEVLAKGQAYRGTFGDWWYTSVRRAVLGVPVMRNDRPVALLYASRDAQRPYVDDDIEVATTFAYYLRSAMINAELYHALRDSEAMLRLITDSINDLIAVVDRTGRVRYASPSHQRELTHMPDALVGKQFTDLAHPDDVAVLHTALARAAYSPKVEYRFRAGSGDWVWVESVLRPVPSANPAIVLSSRVIQERRRLEQELRQQATHDPLTGLANRVLVGQRLEQALSRPDDGTLVGLLFCDLDRFKEVNDRLGHDVGDELLRLVAGRLRSCRRSSDLLARIGGDEFVFVLDGIADLAALADTGRRVIAALETPFTLLGEAVPISASVGGVTGRRGVATAKTMMRNADAAMYAAKRRGPGLVEIFDEDASHRSLDRLDLGSELRGALDRGELTVYYQPIFDIASGAILRLEALVRWQHHERGLILPDVFIPLAEETGAIVPIGRWVLDQAVRQLAEWQSLPGRQDLGVTVNLSAVQLQRHDLARELLGIIDDAGVDRDDVWLEVTEHSAVRSDAAEVVRQLSQGGVKLCLDDFGISHSNLDSLVNLPVDCIKIDRSFVAGLTGDLAQQKISRGIVRAVLAIASSLDLSVVAEGIELREQRIALQELGCGRGQGFLLSRPLPADQATDLLRRSAAEVLADTPLWGPTQRVALPTAS